MTRVRKLTTTIEIPIPEDDDLDTPAEHVATTLLLSFNTRMLQAINSADDDMFGAHGDDLLDMLLNPITVAADWDGEAYDDGLTGTDRLRQFRVRTENLMKEAD